MAKLSIIMRERSKLLQSERARKTRDKLRSLIKKASADEQEAAILALQKRPRNESPCRVRSRCRCCGRPRGTLRRFGLCRICLRKAAMRGDVPGLRKASW